MKSNETLDLRGVPCPANSARALIQIATMSEGEILELFVDEGEPFENVPASIEGEGHTIVGSRALPPKGWTLLVRIGGN